MWEYSGKLKKNRNYPVYNLSFTTMSSVPEPSGPYDSIILTVKHFSSPKFLEATKLLRGGGDLVVHSHNMSDLSRFAS
jgi:hypothetical protein